MNDCNTSYPSQPSEPTITLSEGTTFVVDCLLFFFCSLLPLLFVDTKAHRFCNSILRVGIVWCHAIEIEWIYKCERGYTADRVGWLNYTQLKTKLNIREIWFAARCTVSTGWAWSRVRGNVRVRFWCTNEIVIALLLDWTPYAPVLLFTFDLSSKKQVSKGMMLVRIDNRNQKVDFHFIFT